MKHRLFTAALCLALLASPLLTSTASAHWEFHDVNGQYLFGYTGVESAYEYESEVAHSGIKTNVTTLSTEYNTVLGPYIDQHNAAGNKVGIFLDTVLFQSATPSWYLRPDYKWTFDQWYNRNKLYLTSNRVAFLIINSEANNRGITRAALDTATEYVKSKLPALPTIVGYGFGGGGGNILSQGLPSKPDGFGFWHYAVLHPETPGTPFQTWLTYFKQNMNQQTQRLIIVFDAHYGPWHVDAGLTQEMVGDIAIRYADIARNEPLVVGMLGFTWAGFGDVLGLRDVSQGMRIKNITASCKLLPCP
jgi:hypothetical protein